MLRNYVLILFAALWSIGAIGQNLSIDSLIDKRTGLIKALESPIGQASVAGATLTVGGLLIKSQDGKFRHLRSDYMPKPEHTHDYYLQLAPAAIMLGMKAFGVEGESTWPQMLVADAAAFFIMSGTVEGLKHTVDECRPDGSDEHSFPSGHTATAFMTATMLHHEYGSRYPWLSVAGYGLATTTGFLRVHDNRHWLGDVVTGAGIGILSTELGYVVSDLIFHRPILKDQEYFNKVGTDYCPSFLSYYVSYDTSSNTYDWCAGKKLKLSAGCSLGVEGAWFFMPYLGVGGKATYSDLKFYADDVPQSYPIKYVAAQAGVYNSTPFSSRLALDVKIICGYGRYESMEVFDVNGVETHIDANGGFTYCAGVGLTWRATSSLSYRLFSDFSSLPRQSSEAEHINLVSYGAQVAINF